MSKDKRFYSWDQDTKAVAFIDILGFSGLTSMDSVDEPSRASSLFTFFENCILPYRKSMLQQFPREVPTTATGADFKASFWHQEVPIGAVNFVYLSDSAVLYSHSLTHLFRELSAIYGSAITFSVPIRGAITTGGLHHSEWIERPGSGICLYGDALTNAVSLEKSVSGAGMRLWLESSVVELARAHGLNHWIVPPEAEKPAELRWWLGAYNPGSWGTESQELERQFGRWFTEKQIRHWFKGDNCENTKAVVARALSELKSLNR